MGMRVAMVLLSGLLAGHIAMADESVPETAGNGPPAAVSDVTRPEVEAERRRDERPSSSEEERHRDRERTGESGEAPSTDDRSAGSDADPVQLHTAFTLLGSTVPPGELRRLGWQADSHLSGLEFSTPVLVAHGTSPGPVLCLTAAIHGDELNGIEIVRRIVHSVDPQKLAGTLIGVPVVNLVGFQRSSRYLSDRRDLNRYFPGDSAGSLASRVADSFFENIVRHCSWLVDLHTGSFHRSNLTQLRADLSDPAVREMTRGFGGLSVLHSRGRPGTLRRAASDAGIPTVTIEAGEPMRLQQEKVDQGVRGIETLMNQLEMVRRVRFWAHPQPVYYESYWVRPDRSGILLSSVKLGDRVISGSVLGTVVDPITNVKETLTAPYSGRVLGMALDQVVMPGFAAFRIGIETSEDSLARDAEDPVDHDVDIDIDPDDGRPAALSSGDAEPPAPLPE